MSALKAANLALAFLLELAALAAFAVWGYGISDQAVVRIPVAVVVVVIGIVLWGVFAAPNSTRRLRGLALLGFKLGFFALAALALAASDRAALGVVLAVLTVVNLALAYAWKQETL